MIIDNTAGFQFLLSEDIYLLKQDLGNLKGPDMEQPVTVPAEPEYVAEEPLISPPEPIFIKQTPVLRFDYMGGNKQNFLIICSYNGAIDEKHVAALTSTLQRKELSLDDVAIMNLVDFSGATNTQLMDFFKPARLLILGNDSQLLGWDKFKLNELQNAEGVKVLYTHSFGEMMGDRDKTKAFWEQMKVL